MKVTIEEAKLIIKEGGVIAYPTETTYGLGCDAFNPQALEKLMMIKERDKKKGLIVLIERYEQLAQLSHPLTQKQMENIYEKWPGSYTFIFPSLPNLPYLLTGGRQSIAIRMSSHPIAQTLSKESPITSTSANISSQEVITNVEEIIVTFEGLIDGVIDAPAGQKPPSSIIDAITGKQYR